MPTHSGGRRHNVPMSDKTMLLVDGSSYLYRAFHAMPDLRAEGFPTGAIHGMVAMMKRLREQIPAEHAVCVFDAKGKTFRDDWYPEYKANRPPMPDDLVRQIAPLHECIEALGWPLIMESGVEADDVIGTLARQAAAQGIEVIISTGDKDLAQLVGPHVTLVNTMSNEVLDEAGVLAKFGVPPERIVDYLALMGDTVDNVPGVTKCGPKTAVKWLSQYGTLDNIVKNAPDIGGAVGENLRQSLDWLSQAKQLLTIKCDVELPLRIDELAPQPQDVATLATLFDRFEFKTWRRELDGGSGTDAATETTPAAVAPPPAAVPSGLVPYNGRSRAGRYSFRC